MSPESIAEGMGIVIQSPPAIGSQKTFPQRSLRLGGEPDFQTGKCESKSPMKSIRVSTIPIYFGQQ